MEERSMEAIFGFALCRECFFFFFFSCSFCSSRSKLALEKKLRPPPPRSCLFRSNSSDHGAFPSKLACNSRESAERANCARARASGRERAARWGQEEKSKPLLALLLVALPLGRSACLLLFLIPRGPRRHPFEQPRIAIGERKRPRKTRGALDWSGIKVAAAGRRRRRRLWPPNCSSPLSSLFLLRRASLFLLLLRS